MKSKLALVLLLGLLAIVGVAQVSADTQPLSLVIGFEHALNLGDADAMTALFTDDAVYVYTVGGKPVIGRDAIREFLGPRMTTGRNYEIVGVSMAGDQLTLTVDISDRGVTWGRQTLRVVAENGLIQSMETVNFRILF